MKATRIFGIILTALFVLGGCTTIVDSTTTKPIESDPGQRTLGTFLDDERLEVIVGVNINKADPALKKSHIRVISYNNIILLVGQVPDESLKQLAQATAENVTRVRQVHNELRIKGNTALLVRTNDTWLSTKIQGTFITDKLINNLKVKTIVEDSTVYLMGKMTRSEADYVAEVASGIGGVQEVVKVFEYID